MPERKKFLEREWGRLKHSLEQSERTDKNKSTFQIKWKKFRQNYLTYETVFVRALILAMPICLVLYAIIAMVTIMYEDTRPIPATAKPKSLTINSAQYELLAPGIAGKKDALQLLYNRDANAQHILMSCFKINRELISPNKCNPRLKLQKLNLGWNSNRRFRLDGSTWATLDLSHSNFKNANLVGARFINVRLGNAEFAGADLRHAEFTRMIFSLTTPYDDTMTRAKFIGADLSNASFKQSRLLGITFQEANLSNVTFEGNTFLNEHRLKGAWAWADQPPLGLKFEHNITLCDPKLRDNYAANKLMGYPPECL